MRASTPAFAQSRFTPPACATTSFAAAASDSTEVTSTPSASARPPADRISAATFSALARWRSATATVIPSAASPSAMPRPIPLPPPVTTATRPRRSFMQDLLLLPEFGIVPGTVERLLASAERGELGHAQHLHRLPVAEVVDGEPLEGLGEGPTRVAQDD